MFAAEPRQVIGTSRLLGFQLPGHVAIRGYCRVLISGDIQGSVMERVVADAWVSSGYISLHDNLVLCITCGLFDEEIPDIFKLKVN